MPLFVTTARFPVLGGLAAVALAATVVLPATADDPPPTGGYPSWADVQAAQSSEASKAGEITIINGLLSRLEAESEAAGEAAVRSAAGYAAADAGLQAASSRLETLSARSAHANQELARYRKDLGALAVESYKTGGTNTGFFVALDALGTNSVQGLNLVKLVGDKTAALVTKAAAAEQAAAALADQEKVARSERERLAAEAKATLESARAAQDSLARQVAEEQRHGGELTAQLAALKGTTAALEGEYRQGQAAQAAYEAAQAAKRAAAQEQARQQAEAEARASAAAAQQPKAPAPAANPAPAGPVQPGGVQPVPAPPPAVDPGPAAPEAPAPPAQPAVVVPSVPGGAVNDPAGAKSYASGRLAAYGWGQDQFLCLAQLWTKESSWLTTATNAYSGAYGIAQALPPGKYASAGSDWLTSYRTQVDWGLGYIKDRYGSPCAAWNHSAALNWY
ncbi:lytic transglycosylase domain-containing protein [Pseudarthrobacter niigatensis]|uniref:Septal ring factor EnvC (AmiA/AmiB activator) n=1 Tax=Pseudarthrobacter niigatensis TaxID=369935 RepID=A0AAJ1SNS3_9MICC|nr:lytic transglycosylase domain-containing protein [Pseudarthrobacter niigatensis]MDQ0144262.1 septal ring factor EnvC (AmiA/AmiB activator) [Pseudarthrobacter niigatensis]MDQ0266522.1 septal ring factor EnvC (AmiA/AmiB activator) [Pseudarthrobacter niigatensis]